jgi:hypothetical protein
MPSADAGGPAASELAAARLPDFTVRRLQDPANQIFQTDPDLSAKLTTALDDNSISTTDTRLAFAIADLTKDAARGFDLHNPAYAGVNDTEYGTVASMAKLLPLYGAYQLRYDLRKYIDEGAGDSSIPDVATLANRARAGYRIFPSAAEDHQDIPLIEKIFSELSTGTSLDFHRGDQTEDDLQGIDSLEQDRLHHPDTRQIRTFGKLRNPNKLATELDASGGTPQALYFFEQLRLMVGWSNDTSAAIVIESLGFPYLWELGFRSNLFHDSWFPIRDGDASGFRGGLFIAHDYSGTKWTRASQGWSTPPWLALPCSGGPHDPVQGGTARSVALLMTVLAEDQLIGEEGHFDTEAETHAEIRELMRNFPFPQGRAVGERSPIGQGVVTYAPSEWNLTQDKWTPGDPFPENLAVSKLGLLRRSHVSNAVLIRAGRTGKDPISAVLVGINRTGSDEAPLKKFAKIAVQILSERHP